MSPIEKGLARYLMERDTIAYEWVCPVCGKSRKGLLGPNEEGVTEKVKNSLLAHIRISRGGGHGPEQEYPPTFDPDGALNYIQIWGGIEDPISGTRTTASHG